MSRNGRTIKEATEEWVREMNAFQQDFLLATLKDNYDAFYEVTEPAYGDKVYTSEYGSGEIEEVNVNEETGERTYVIGIYEGDAAQVELQKEDFEVERDSFLPMWGWMWQFDNSCDDWWLEEGDGIQIMSECGFRIYQHDEFGYFFGIDGCGYDFYEAHWIPLYKARGLRWHDERAESGEFYMTDEDKAELYDGMLGYLCELISDKSELVRTLKRLGFTDEQLKYEGIEEEGE